MEHILLQRALKYKKRNKIETPDGYAFDNMLGAWVNQTDRNLLIKSENFPTIGSKKEDVETGEDQKGE